MPSITWTQEVVWVLRNTKGKVLSISAKPPGELIEVDLADYDAVGDILKISKEEWQDVLLYMRARKLMKLF